MNICLNCEIEYKAKKATSKYCSDKCRVAYFRKNDKTIKVTASQMEEMNNSIKELISRLDIAVLPSEKYSKVMEVKKELRDKGIISKDPILSPKQAPKPKEGKNIPPEPKSAEISKETLPPKLPGEKAIDYKIRMIELGFKV